MPISPIVAKVGIGIILAIVAFFTSNLIYPSAPAESNQTFVNQTTIENVTDTLLNPPIQDMTDFVWGGTTGVAKWFSKLIKGVMEIIASFVLKAPVVFPEWIGFIAFALIFMWILMTQWTNLWGFIMDNIFRAILILAVVFVLGVVLTYVGAV